MYSQFPTENPSLLESRLLNLRFPLQISHFVETTEFLSRQQTVSGFVQRFKCQVNVPQSCNKTKIKLIEP
jgi:hypothetical protein